jgi:pyridinium-3,5-biscarboxylic acid mononucleotide sulfurtransferase
MLDDREITGRERTDLEALERCLEDVTSACVAFSGGVDSSLLLWAAGRRIPRERVAAFTAVSPTYLPEELTVATSLARDIGVELIVAETDEFDDPRFAGNPKDRCYYCKRHLLEAMAAAAEARGLETLLDGANHDDLGDQRPGMRAAAELGVRHPLLEAGLGKDAVRGLARAAGLPTWDAPQQACLASRIPYGETITRDKLEAVAAAERVLHELGFRQCRVRHHGAIARVEVEPGEVGRAAGAAREEIARRLRALGFTYVTVDLDGFRSGSMNEVWCGPQGGHHTPSGDEPAMVG